MLRIVDADDEAALAGLYSGGWDAPPHVVAAVAEMLRDVRGTGDEALVRYTQRVDFAGAEAATLRRAVPTLAEAESFVPETIAAGPSHMMT